MYFGMEAPRGIDQYHVRAAALCRLQPVKNDSGRIGTRSVLDDVDADALCPNIELLDGRGAKRVAGDEQDLLARLAVLRREFSDRCCLSDPVNAEKQNHPRAD